MKSQAYEGWRLAPERHDDGGLSGASLERPALQQLLAPPHNQSSPNGVRRARARNSRR